MSNHGFGGYELQPKATPHQLPLIIEAAKNCVIEYAEVKKGENVLILVEFTSDPLIPQALASVAMGVGAEVSIMYLKPLSPGGMDTENPSAMTLGAYREADAVLSCSYYELAHSKRLFFKEITKYKARVVSMLMTATSQAFMYGGRFPIPLFRAIAGKAMMLGEGCKRIRITDVRGTDLVFENPVMEANPYHLKPGSWGVFPLGGLNWSPTESHGHFYFDESVITGRPEEPVKVVIEHSLVKEIQGGMEAEAIRAFANGLYYLRHAHIGLNPKMRFHGAPQFERERSAGTFYLGLDGMGKLDKIDRTVPGFSHLDCIIDHPTVHFDDQPIIKNRRLLLLEDPEIRKAASQYGNPDRLLSQNHLLW